MRSALALLALFVLTGCATDRYDWSIAHLSLSPRAKKLGQSEVREIVKLVVDASSRTVIGVGTPCDGLPGVINVVVDYRSDRYMIYKLKKIEGRWKITGHDNASPGLTELFDFC